MEGFPKKIKVEGAPSTNPLEETREKLENPPPDPSDAVWDELITGEKPPQQELKTVLYEEAVTEEVAQVENAPPPETTPAIFGIKPEELASVEGWGELSEGQKMLALENLKQITLARIKEESAARYKKNIAEEKTGAALWRRMWIGMKENFAKSYTTLKLEKTLAEELKEGGMAMHGEVLAQVVRAAKNGPEVEIKENGKTEFVYLSEKIAGFSVNFSPEDHEKTEAYNRAATEFARVPDEWKYEVASDKQRRAYEKAREKYETARGNVLEMIYLSERSLDASESMAQENAMLFVNDVDGMVRMNQFFNTHPDAEKEIAKIEDSSLWKRIGAQYFKGAIEKGGYGLLGYGARWATISMLGLVGAPLAAAGIGGFRARKKAEERVREEELTARRGGKEKYERWQKNIVDAESLTKKLEKLSNQVGEVDEGGEASEERKKLLAALSLRAEYTQRKLDDGLVGFGRAEKRADNQYKLINALAFARTALEAGTKKGNETLSARLERFLTFKERNIPEARRNFLNREMLRGAATAAGFATAGWLIRDFFSTPTLMLTKETLEAIDEGDASAFSGGLDDESIADTGTAAGGWSREELPPPNETDINALDSMVTAEKESLTETPLTRGLKVDTSPEEPPSPEVILPVTEAPGGEDIGPELSEYEKEVPPEGLSLEDLEAIEKGEEAALSGENMSEPESPFGAFAEGYAAPKTFEEGLAGAETPMVTPEQIRNFARGSENYFAASREMFRDAADRVANADRMIRELNEKQGVLPEDALNDPAVKKELEDAEKIFREATEMRARGYGYVRSVVVENQGVTPEAKLEIIGTQIDDAERVSHLAKLATLVENEPAMQQFAGDELYPAAVNDWVEAHGNAVQVNEEIMAKHSEIRAAKDAVSALIKQRDALIKEINEFIEEEDSILPDDMERRQSEIEDRMEDMNRALDGKTKEFADLYKKVLDPEAVPAARQPQEVNTIDAIHKKFYEGNGLATEVSEVVKIMRERTEIFDMNGEGRILGAEETLAGKKFIGTFDNLSYYEQEGFLGHLRQHLESVKTGRGVWFSSKTRYDETLEELVNTLEKRVKIPASGTSAPELVKAVSEAFTGERAAEARDLIHRYALIRGGVSTEKLTAFARNINNIDRGVMSLLFKEGGDSEENRLELLKIILRHKWFEIDRFSLKQAENFEDLVEDSDRFGGILKYLDNEKISFEERRQMLANYLALRTLGTAEDPKVTKERLFSIVRSIAPEGRKGAIELLVRNAVSSMR